MNSLQSTFPFTLKNYDWDNKIPIGQSSYSIVYKVKILDSKKDQYVAIKKFVLPKIYLAYEMFIQQLEKLRNLKNDFIVKCIDTQICEDGGYIVMELCQCDIGTYLEKYDWRMPQKMVKRIISHIIEALSILRNNNFNVVYVNSKNFVVKNGQVKINPIGLGKYQVNLHQSSISSLPLYMAPQVIESEDLSSSQNNSRAIVWSIGVIAYQLFVGSLPLSYQNWETYKNKIQKQNIFIDDELLPSVTIQQFIQRCLIKDQNQRASWQQISNHHFIQKTHESILKSLTPQMLNIWKKIKLNLFQNKVHFSQIICLEFSEFSQLTKKQFQYSNREINNKQIAQIFKEYDFKNNSIIQMDEINAIFKIFKIQKDNQYLFMRNLAESIRKLNINIYKIVQNIDNNKNKLIDYEQMKNLVYHLLPHSEKTMVQKTWIYLQRIHQGKLSISDMLQQLLRYLPKHKSQIITRGQKAYLQFKSALESQEQQIEDLFNFFDRNNDNKINFKQFVALFNSILGFERLQEIKIVFNTVNQSKSGFITLYEMRTMLKATT